MAPRTHVQTLNALSLPDFLATIWPQTEPFSLPNDSQVWHFVPETSSTISEADFESCFQLVRETSSRDYEASSMGWRPKQKRKEMRLPDMKYCLLKRISGGSAKSKGSEIIGFMSFMLTYEDGIEVIYCYEIHVADGKGCRGKGVGKRMMEHLEEVGRRAGVKKAMLTVFRANEEARKFYDRLGYLEDEFSPRPKKLRGGVLKEADYLILSKPLASLSDKIRGENVIVEDGIGEPEEAKKRSMNGQMKKRKAI